MNKVLLDFEKHTGLGPTYAAELLGVAYSTYAQVRSGSRPLQKYVRYHIEMLVEAPKDSLTKLISERVRNGRNKA